MITAARTANAGSDSAGSGVVAGETGLCITPRFLSLWEQDMRLAMREAAKAARRGEVPVGALLVSGGKEILGRGYNTREAANDPTAHAEIHAIRRAARKLKTWRLTGSTLVVTLEPCIQCVGAAILARVDTVVFGCRDPKGGALGSVVDLRAVPGVNHRLKVIDGVLSEECAEILTGFFRALRAKRRAKHQER